MPAEADDPFAFRPLPGDFDQQAPGVGSGMPGNDPFAAFGGAGAIGSAAADQWNSPPPVLQSMPALPAARPSASQGEETIVSGGFVVLSWLCLLTLGIDLVIWIVLGVVSALKDPPMLPRAFASQLMIAVPSPFLTSILFCILTAWAASRLPEHAREEGIGVLVAKWIVLSLMPVILLVAIGSLGPESTRLPFFIASGGIMAMLFCCDVPRSLTKSLNDRIGQDKWKVSWWLGPTASGLMAASCIFVAGVNVWMAITNATNKEVSMAERLRENASLVLILGGLALVARLFGLLFTAIWGIQLGMKLRTVPRRAVASRTRFG
jgi:hypothetical protein